MSAVVVLFCFNLKFVSDLFLFFVFNQHVLQSRTEHPPTPQKGLDYLS